MAYADVVLADNPVAYWRLGEAAGTTANDEVGSTDGTYTNTPTLGVAGALDGDADTAMTIDTTQYVEVPDSATVSITGAISVECWVKATDLSGTFVSKVADRVQGTAAQGGYELLVTGGRHRFKISNGTTTAEANVIDDPYVDGEWHHFVGTWDGTSSGTNVYLYVDGEEVGSASFSGPSIIDTSTVLRIGRPIGSNVVYLIGSIDEVALYDSALSPTRVLAHFCAGKPSDGKCRVRFSVGMLRFS